MPGGAEEGRERREGRSIGSYGRGTKGVVEVAEGGLANRGSDWGYRLAQRTADERMSDEQIGRRRQRTAALNLGAAVGWLSSRKEYATGGGFSALRGRPVRCG